MGRLRDLSRQERYWEEIHLAQVSIALYIIALLHKLNVLYPCYLSKHNLYALYINHPSKISQVLSF